MQTVDAIAKGILRREGGYVDDPDDPGGATKHGVTVKTLQRLGLDLNRDGEIDKRDVKRLTEADALSIFKEYYFVRPGLEKLPAPVQASVFDMYVNAGRMAVVLFQRLLAAFGENLAADGAIGPLTAAAATRAERVAPHHLTDAYGIERRKYYYALADRRPASRKFARRRDGGKGGWILRAEEFIDPRYHLTDDAHRARVAAWD